MQALGGLTSDEASSRLKKYGPNVLPEKPPPSSFSIFFSQFKNPLVYVLVVAGAVTFFLQDYSDTAIIFFVVLVNSILGYVQEKKASNTLESLKSLVHPKAVVIRAGKKVDVDVENIVPGDQVILSQGGKVPADGVVISANRFQAEEAVLTGESRPIDKGIDEKVFMGTLVASGEAVMKVTTTGADTQMGKIALSVQDPVEDSPLTRQLKLFSNQLTKLVIALITFVFIVGLVAGLEVVEIFKTSVALAVSSIPEGLLIAITVVLAIGMQRILKKKGLVRNLVSAETLGGVTSLCVDKTGTLTHGKLEVVEVDGEKEELCLQYFASPDDPVMQVAKSWLETNLDDYEKRKREFDVNTKHLDVIPFSPENRYYATLVKHKDGNREAFVNGAPELLVERSKLDAEKKGEIKEEIKKLTTSGKRVIGLAKKIIQEGKDKLNEKDIEAELVWVGLLVFSDPVRVGVRTAFEHTKSAGIKTVVITGDYAETAMAVMNELNMQVSEDRVVMGETLENMSEDEVVKKLEGIYRKGDGAVLFARTKPEQKLKVVYALQESGEIVAMMGDGVNDAPALHKADIGIVVGEATDVAKESADLILLDSSFETIVDAVREGRGIFDNIRKIILYLMCDAYAEIVAVIGAIMISVTIMSGLPLPVTAAQILWINIVSDGFPHLALTVDPKSKDIMDRPPRLPKDPIVAGWMKGLIAVVSIISGLTALLLFIHYYLSTGSIELSRSFAFAILGVNSLVYVFSVRTLTRPFWEENPFKNRWLNLAVLAGFVFQLLPFLITPLRGFFEIEMLSLSQWGLVLAASLVMFAAIETVKGLLRAKAVA